MSKALTDIVNFGIGAIQTIQEESVQVLENIKKRVEELEAAGASSQSENAKKLRTLASDLGAKLNQPTPGKKSASAPKKSAAAAKAKKPAKAAKTPKKATTASKSKAATAAKKAPAKKSTTGPTRKKALESAAESL